MSQDLEKAVQFCQQLGHLVSFEQSSSVGLFGHTLNISDIICNLPCGGGYIFDICWDVLFHLIFTSLGILGRLKVRM